MQVWRMRTGISITLKPVDRRRLTTVAGDRNAPHKHVWRAEIVLLSADGVGTNEIMCRTGKSKTCVWRWQERFMQAGYDGFAGAHAALGELELCFPPDARKEPDKLLPRARHSCTDVSRHFILPQPSPMWVAQ